MADGACCAGCTPCCVFFVQEKKEQKISQAILHSMQTTDPKDLLPTLHLVRAGLASGLLTKEEVVEWADQIITKDEQPHIFFIDLAMSSSKSVNDLTFYIGDYLNFEEAVINGRPLLGLLYKQYQNNSFDLDQTISKLFRLRYEAVFTDREMGSVYALENDYDAAKHNIYGTVEQVKKELEKFLSLYQNYSIHNEGEWQHLDQTVELQLQALDQPQPEILVEHLHMEVLETTKPGKHSKPWWKFW